MKLWLLKLTELGAKKIGGYETPQGYVVRAETETQARDLAHTVYEWADNDGFTNPEYATCVELTYEGEAGVIICDFLEG